MHWLHVSEEEAEDMSLTNTPARLLFDKFCQTRDESYLVDAIIVARYRSLLLVDLLVDDEQVGTSRFSDQLPVQNSAPQGDTGCQLSVLVEVVVTCCDSRPPVVQIARGLRSDA
eukprot:754307-Hanusia_phi.AAC.3